MAARAVAVVQARLASTRLPGKALLDIAGRPMLAHVLERTRAIPGLAGVVVATTVSAADDPLVEVARALGAEVVRGSADDVLDRFRVAARTTAADAVVRVTADCPLLDPAVSSLVLAEYERHAGGVDYVSNVHPPTYPDGLDTEVIGRDALERAWREARGPADREHVTPYIWRHAERFRLANVAGATDLSALRWTVDTAADVDFVRAVYGALDDGARRRPFGMADVLALLAQRPALAALNAGQRRNDAFLRQEGECRR